MKSHFYFLATILLGGALLSGCASKMTITGGGPVVLKTVSALPSVVQFALTDDAASKVAKDSFTPNTAKIYAGMSVDRINDGDRVKTAFVCDSAIDPTTKKEIKNHTLDSSTQTMKSGMTGVEASTSKPATNPWPVGDYHVDIYINDRLAKTAKFTVADAKS